MPILWWSFLFISYKALSFENGEVKWDCNEPCECFISFKIVYNQIYWKLCLTWQYYKQFLIN